MYTTYLYIRKQDGIYLSGIEMVGLSSIQMAFKNQIIWHPTSFRPFKYQTSSVFWSPLDFLSSCNQMVTPFEYLTLKRSTLKCLYSMVVTWMSGIVTDDSAIFVDKIIFRTPALELKISWVSSTGILKRKFENSNKFFEIWKEKDGNLKKKRFESQTAAVKLCGKIYKLSGHWLI